MPREVDHYVLAFEAPIGEHPQDIVTAISEEVEGGEDSGFISHEGEGYSWMLTQQCEGVQLDPRQRRAAAMLLTAFDGPGQDMLAVSKTLLEATRICPGLTCGSNGDVPGPSQLNRLAMLRTVYADLGTILEEAERDEHQKEQKTWFWWCGPSEDEFLWGRFTSKQAAADRGRTEAEVNGSASFFIIEARSAPGTADSDGTVEFIEQRNLEEILLD